MFNAVVNLFFNFYQISKCFCGITYQIYSSPPRKYFNCLKMVQQNILIAPMNFHYFVFNLKFYKNEPLYTRILALVICMGINLGCFCLTRAFIKISYLQLWWYVWKAKRTQRVNWPKIFVIFINHYIQKIRNPWETTEFVTYCHIINMIL